jgi:hypothetical protein
MMGKDEVVLICMRLDEMTLVHPKQIKDECSRCKATVGIYPSGQKILKIAGLVYRDGVKIVCNRCADRDKGFSGGIAAPGVFEEMRESVKKSGN